MPPFAVFGTLFKNSPGWFLHHLIKRQPLFSMLSMQATSALDAESEALVQEALDRVATGRTVITIAHRLSTVQSAAEVAVIQGGSIAELGTHENLLHQGKEVIKAN